MLSTFPQKRVLVYEVIANFKSLYEVVASSVIRRTTTRVFRRGALHVPSSGVLISPVVSGHLWVV